MHGYKILNNTIWRILVLFFLWSFNYYILWCLIKKKQPYHRQEWVLLIIKLRREQWLHSLNLVVSGLFGSGMVCNSRAGQFLRILFHKIRFFMLFISLKCYLYSGTVGRLFDSLPEIHWPFRKKFYASPCIWLVCLYLVSWCGR